jgi:hypothetical protein
MVHEAKLFHKAASYKHEQFEILLDSKRLKEISRTHNRTYRDFDATSTKLQFQVRAGNKTDRYKRSRGKVFQTEAVCISMVNGTTSPVSALMI